MSEDMSDNQYKITITAADLASIELLPEPIRDVVLKKRDYINHASELEPIILEGCLQQKECFMLVLPAFTNESARNVWKQLLAISEENTKNLAQDVFTLLFGKIFALNIYESNKVYIENGGELVKNLSKLKELLDRHDFSLSTFLGEYYHSLRREIDGSIAAASSSLDKFKKENSNISKYACEIIPISRKYNSELAGVVFCVKKLSNLFRDIHGKPYNEHVATFVNAIFKTEYSGYDIIQLTKSRKELDILPK